MYQVSFVGEQQLEHLLANPTHFLKSGVCKKLLEGAASAAPN